MNDHIVHDHSNDGIDRRGFLKCMAWAGTGVLWSLQSGVLTSRALGQTTPGAPALAAPEFILHTGDLTHLAEAAEFDGLEQMLKDCRTKQVFYVPGEHDILNDNGALYRERFAAGTLGTGWHSYDRKGVHFIGLVNV